MRLGKLTSTQQTVLFVFTLLFGSFVIFSVGQIIRKNERAKRWAQLENVNKRAVNVFKNSLHNFSTLTAGLKSFVNNSEQTPGPDQIRNYLFEQFEELNIQDSLIISFIDTEGIFKYVFTRTQNDPAKLVGKSLYDIRRIPEGEDVMKWLDFPNLSIAEPVNLVEGWVGIPINFDITSNDEKIGIITAVISFKSLINDIYDTTVIKDYAFKFSTASGVTFDRERVDDGKQIFNERVDPESYKNFNIDPEEEFSSEVDVLGTKFIITSAFKKADAAAGWWIFFIYSWYVLLLTFLALILFQSYRYRRVNESLKSSNKIITSQKQDAEIQNTELEKLNSTKNRFFSIIAHDLKNPFSAIHSIIGLIKEHNLSPEESNAMIGNLSDITTRTQNLLENLLKWAQVQTGELEYQFNVIILSQLVEDIVQRMRFQAQAKNITINCDLEKDLVINADYEMFSTILKNLISNGLKYSQPNEGKIDITTRSENGQIQITVKDNGVGIAEEEKEILFNLDRGPSFQGTQGEKGTGLGLTLSKEFLRLHNGQIEVESIKGKGSTFTVTVPKADINSSKQ